MMFFKKYWYLFFLILVTVGLGLMVFLTTRQLSKRELVTRPPSQAVVPACTLTFSIEETPTPTPTLPPDVTPTHTPTPTQTGTPTPTLPPDVTPTETPTPTMTPTNTPTNTPTRTGTPTPTTSISVACNSSCVVNSDCAGDNVCYNGFCRNPSCLEEADCVCEITQVVTCNDTCTVNTDCGSGLVCLENLCRNPSCPGEADCVCEEIAVAPTPKVPVSGGPGFFGFTTIAGGFLLLLLGLLL